MNIVDQIFEYAKKYGVIDDESMAYYPNDYPFSQSEFLVLWEYFHKTYQNQLDDCSDMFYDARLYLEYKNEYYIWRVLVGQGTACQLFHSFENNPKFPNADIPFEFKEKHKIIVDHDLYKLLEKEYTELNIKEIIE